MAWTERYVSTAGGGAHDGTSEANAWTLAEAIAAPYAAGQRINVKAGTYANTTTNRTFGVTGTTTAPIWWRGYNSAIGDLDDDFATAKPAITFTTGQFQVIGANHIFSNLSISGACTSQQVDIGAHYSVFFRCRIENTSATANARCYRSNAYVSQIAECYLKANAAADYVVICDDRNAVQGCSIRGADHGILGNAATTLVIEDCVFDDQDTYGILYQNGPGTLMYVRGCSFYSPGTDGIRLSTVPVYGVIRDCVFANAGGYGINNASGANTNQIVRFHNDFYSNTSGTETGFGDAPAYHGQTESSSPFTDAAGHDFSLVSGANAKATGSPGAFEGESYTSFLDIGAAQREEPAGSGGVIGGPNMRAGMM